MQLKVLESVVHIHVPDSPHNCIMEVPVGTVIVLCRHLFEGKCQHVRFMSAVKSVLRNVLRQLMVRNTMQGFEIHRGLGHEPRFEIPDALPPAIYNLHVQQYRMFYATWMNVVTVRAYMGRFLAPVISLCVHHFGRLAHPLVPHECEFYPTLKRATHSQKSTNRILSRPH